MLEGLSQSFLKYWSVNLAAYFSMDSLEGARLGMPVSNATGPNSFPFNSF